MKKSRIPSPARSVGPSVTPRRYKTTRATRSVGSPARSTTSERLSTFVEKFREDNMDSFALSPVSRNSILSDNTDIDLPTRKSWWKKLDDNSRDTMEVVHNTEDEVENILDYYLNEDTLTQEKLDHITNNMDLPESSDCESIASIVLPERRLFTHKESQPKKNFWPNVMSREALANQDKTRVEDKTLQVKTKKLFGQVQQKRKPIFPKDLITSPDNTLLNDELTSVSPKKLFSQEHSKKKRIPALPSAAVHAFEKERALANLERTEVEDKTLYVKPKTLFGLAQKRKPIFPKDLITSPNKTLPNDELTNLGPKKLFYQEPSKNKRSSAIPSAGVHALEKEANETGTPLHKNAIGKPMFSSTLIASPNKTLSNYELSNIKAKNTFRQEHTKKRPALLSDTDLDSEKEENEPRNFEHRNLFGRHKKRTKFYFPTLSVDNSMADEEQDNKSGSKVRIQHSNNEENIQNKDVQNDIDELSDRNIILGIESDRSFVGDAEKDNEPENRSTEIERHKENYEPAEENDEGVCQSGLEKQDKQHEESHPTYIEENEEDNNGENNDQLVYKEDSVDENIEQNDLEMEKNCEHNDRSIAEELEPDNQFAEKEKGYEDTDTSVAKTQENENQESDEQENKNEESDNQGAENEEDNDITVVDEQENENEESDNQDAENEEDNDITVVDEQENENEESDNQGAENEKDNDITVVDEQENENEESDNQGSENEEDNDMTVVDDQENENEESDTQSSSNEEDNDVAVLDEQEYENEESDDQYDNDEQNYESNDITVAEEHDSENQESDDEFAENEQENDMSVVDEQENEEPDDQYIENAENYQDNDITVAEEKENESNYEDKNMYVDEEQENEESDDQYDKDVDDNRVKENENNDQLVAKEQEQNIINESRNVTHDTTGRNRKKIHNKTNNKSPEAKCLDKTNPSSSYVHQGRNTSIRYTKSMIRPDLRPSLAAGVRDSIGTTGSDSSAQGSGWDSHRNERKTLRQTFGRDFTPRKSLRALVMEKSAKRQTLPESVPTESMNPQANSTELNMNLPGISNDVEDLMTEESDHDLSKRKRQANLEAFFDKLKDDVIARKQRMKEKVAESLKEPRKTKFFNFKMPPKSGLGASKVKPGPSKPKSKYVPSDELLNSLPPDLRKDLSYKPPKRFNKASWCTKRLYKFLETKLEPKYDYKARVRAEFLVEKLYELGKTIKKQNVASQESIDELKREMARLNIVKTHFEFYDFFMDYMPREMRLKVVPDCANNLPLPKHGIYSDI